MLRRGLLGLLLPVLALAMAGSVSADLGVGVNHGAIAVAERLAPGGAYSLPSLGVINTGTEAADYQVEITYLQGQKESRPPSRWFEVRPQNFRLEPGQTQQVDLRLTLPTGADAGEYFAFIEAHAVKQGTGTSVGVAAAARLSFSVKPSSWLEAQRMRVERFLDENRPWTQVAPIGVLLALGLWAFRRHFRLSIRLHRR